MRLALIGVGLIGGSFARAARAAGRVNWIIGFDTEPDALRRALELHVIDDVAMSAAQAARDADLVMLASPVGTMPEIFRAIAGALTPKNIVTDVGSVKGFVIDAARNAIDRNFARFVPGHPIAGSELAGVEHAKSDLFRNALFVGTPHERADEAATQFVEQLWRDLGCRIERMAAKEHDAIFAALSHLPHLLAYALSAYIAQEPDAGRKLALAGPSFRDFTRIARSSPAIWRDICLANAPALQKELAAYVAQLEQLRAILAVADGPALQEAFERAAALNDQVLS